MDPVSGTMMTPSVVETKGTNLRGTGQVNEKEKTMSALPSIQWLGRQRDGGGSRLFLGTACLLDARGWSSKLA